MRVRTFKARTMPEAMARVRAELGEEAIIIASETGRRGVELRAAIEEAPTGAPPGLEDELEHRLLRRLARDEPQETGAPLDPTALAARFAHQGLAPALGQALVEAARESARAEPAEALAAALEKLFAFKPLGLVSRRPVMLVGLPGSGKTVTAAKLAARAVLAGEPAMLLTADLQRAGGVAQLEAFAAVLQVPVTPVAGAAELKQAAFRPPKGRDPFVVIDTAGVNPFDVAEITELARLARVPGLDIVLVLPAGLDPADAGDIARAFAALGAHKLIVTRLDVARRLGGVLAAAEAGRLAFTHASATPYVANGLAPLTSLRLARSLLATVPAPPEETRS